MIAVKKVNQSLVCTRDGPSTEAEKWAFKNEKVKAQESNDEAGWSTLIGRGLPMICSDWMNLGVTDASSLMS